MKKLLFILALLMLTSVSATAAKRFIGDINNDGKVDKTDMTLMLDIIMGRQKQPLDLTFVDMNKDKKVDITDLTLMIAIMKGEKEAEAVNVITVVPVGGERGGFD